MIGDKFKTFLEKQIFLADLECYFYNVADSKVTLAFKKRSWNHSEYIQKNITPALSDGSESKY